jgi:Flp pilus assembly protein TadG
MSVRRKVWDLFEDKRGGVGIIFGLSLIPLVGVVGAALDYSRLDRERVLLHKALDTAVLAGIQVEGKEKEKIAAATEVFAASYSGAAKATFGLQSNILSGQASTNVKLFLTAVLGIATEAVSVTSAATMGGSNKACIYLLEPTQQSLFVNSDSRIDAKGCSIHINSSNLQAAYLNSRSFVDAKSTCIVGKAYENSDSGFVPAAKTGCATEADPLAYLPEPAEASQSCNVTDLVVSSGQKRTLWPGVYCKKLEISSGGEVTFMPGIYVIRDGLFKVSSNAKAAGSDMMLFFQGKDAYLDISSGSTAQLSGRRSGTYAGMIIFQSRNSITLQAPPFIINSHSGSMIEGTVYMLNGTVRVNSQSTSSSASYTAFVVRKMEVNSLSNLLINTDYKGLVPLPEGLKGMGSEQIVRLVR